MTAQLPSGYFPEVALTGPRFHAAGDLTLDMFHHDGRVDAEWLGLTVQEFALLWRLAAEAGERLTGAQLRAFDAPCDGIAAHVAQVRAKLTAAGLAQLVRSDAEGCHFIDLPPGDHLAPFAAA